MIRTYCALLITPNIAEVIRKTTGGRDSEIAPTVAGRISIAGLKSLPRSLFTSSISFDFT